MTRSDLIARLSELHPQLQLKDAESAVKVIPDALSGTLSKGERIEIRGFGSFELNYRSPRKDRNPKTGKAVMVAWVDTTSPNHSVMLSNVISAK